MLSLYNVVSEDGYIARKDGSEDFIPNSYWPHTLEALKQYDRIILGRKTYETIQEYEKELRDSFDDLPVQKIVITKDKNFHPKQEYAVAYAPEEVIVPSLNIVATSGPTLNQYLIDKGMVDKIIYHKVPVAIGSGIKPYRDIGSIEAIKLETK